MSTVDLRFGDCLTVLRELADESVHAVITDPPYGLADVRPERVVTALTAWANGDRGHVPDGRGFMGRAWDAFVPPPAVWDECLRVLKPGGHLLAFAGSRTADLMGLSVRMAGFEIRDTIMWVYGSGFPKSLNVAKAIESGTGRPEDIRRLAMGEAYIPSGRGRVNYDHGAASAMNGAQGEWIPATPAAEQWQGWGTALKPAQEPIIVARKPLAGTVAATVLAHGTGALNVDACRVGSEDGDRTEYSRGRHLPHANTTDALGKFAEVTPYEPHTAGRWPANVVLIHAETCGAECAGGCPVAELDRQSGTLKSGANPTRRGSPKFRDAYGEFQGQEECTPARGADEGGASRFFPTFRYQAKAPARERPKIDGKGWPTVKPQGLMRWLVRLVCPPRGVVLDPFAGTGSTLQAARDEGFASVGIERDEFAYRLACQRLGLPEVVPAAVADAETGESASLVEVTAEQGDPVLVAIAAADSYDELIEIYLEHKTEWTEERTKAAAARRAVIEGVAA